jgi:hypothetical protein
MSLLCFLYMIVCGGSKYVMFSVCCMYLALASGGYDYGWGDIKSLHYTCFCNLSLGRPNIKDPTSPCSFDLRCTRRGSTSFPYALVYG